MAYQPPAVIEEAGLTPALSQDICTMNCLLAEKWRLFYPLVDWLMLDFLPTVSVEAGEADLSGTRPATVIDDLYGEAVPVDANDEFVQPHGDSADAIAVDATQRKVYKTAVPVHAFIERIEPTGDELTRYGHESRRKYKVTVPTGLLDDRKIVVNVGDRIQWAGQTIEVKQAEFPARSYWKYTNIPMFLIAHCTHVRKGS